MGINILKGYVRHDNIEAQNCSFVTVLAKVWIIISFKVETWSQYNDWKDLRRTKQKAELKWEWGSRNEIINVDFTVFKTIF